MNNDLLKLLIDIDKDEALREQITIDPAKAALQYKVPEAEVVQCFDNEVAMMADMVESKGSSILLITTSQ